MKTHWSFWLIGLFALLWNAGGTMNLFMQMSPDTLAQMPSSHQAIANARPFWATAAFAVSVTGGLLGAIFLLLKKPVAVPLFALSLFATIIVTMQTALGNDIMRAPFSLTTGEIVMIIVGPTAAALFFLWYANKWRGAAAI